MTDTATDGTIQSDVLDADGYDAFLSNLTGEDPKKGASTETDEGAAETPATETAEPSEEDTTGEPDEATETTTDPNDPDEQEVEVKVGEETKKAKLRELKRLYGQEAALTRKSQEVAAARTAADTKAAQASSALTALIAKAQERFKPYAELDMLVLSQRMDTESFAQLRADAQAAHSDLQFLQTELGGHMKAEQERAQTAYREAAQACVKELTDPVKGIKGWGEPLYNELMQFAEKSGIENARGIVSPGALRMLHMAHQYAKAQAAAKTAEGKIAKAPQAPTKVLKPGAPKTTSNRSKDAMTTLRSRGDLDSAADAFLASFG